MSARSWIQPSLVGLALRRALAPRGLLAFLLFLVWLGQIQGRESIGGLRVDAGVLSEARLGDIASGLARQGVWIGALLLLIPVLVLRSASAVERLRREDADWLAARPVARTSWALSTWLGLSLAAWLALGAVAVSAEWGKESRETMAYAGSISLGHARRIEGASLGRWRLPDPGLAAPAGSRVRVILLRGLEPEGPTSNVRLELRRMRDADGASGTVGPAAVGMVHGRTILEVEIPEGSGELELYLQNQGTGAVSLLADPGFEFWRPAASDRRASFELLLRAGFALSAAIALGLGFGAWVSPATAGAGVLALWIATWLSWGAVAWLPGLRLPRTLAFIGEGRLPESFDLRGCVGWAVCVLLGIGVAHPGLRSWRHGR